MFKYSSKYQDLPIVWLVGLLLFLFPLLILFVKKNPTNNSNDSTEKKVDKKKKNLYSGWRVVINVQNFIDSLETSSEVLKTLISETDLYLVAKVSNDKEEEEIKSKISSIGIFEKGFNPVKLLFCETNQGKIAFGRQLECTLFLDNDIESLKELNRFIPYIGYVGKENQIKDLKNSIYGENLGNFFENLNKISL